MNYLKRIQKLQHRLQEMICEGLLVEEPVNLYYLTGLWLSAGALFVHQNGALLCVDQRYLEACQKQAPCPVVASDKISLVDLVISKEFSLSNLGFNAETTSFKRYDELKNKIGHQTRLVPLDNPIKWLRMIKDQEEIDLLSQAAILGKQGFEHLCSLLYEGVKEIELAIELEVFWKKRGSLGVAFDPIVAFGSNGSMPHYRAGQTSLKKGMSVLMDIGVNLQRYHSDLTRTFFFGEPNPEIMDIYTVVEQAQKAALNLCKPGTTIKQLDEAARGWIKDKGYGDYFTHGLGHGVGLEIHEFPSLKNITPWSDQALAPGMVITIEPGIYLPGKGGVRIEDTILITEEGYKNLCDIKSKRNLGCCTSS